MRLGRLPEAQKHLENIQKAKKDVENLIKDQKDLRKETNSNAFSATPDQNKKAADQEGGLKNRAEDLAKDLKSGTPISNVMSDGVYQVPQYNDASIANCPAKRLSPVRWTRCGANTMRATAVSAVRPSSPRHRCCPWFRPCPGRIMPKITSPAGCCTSHWSAWP